MSIVFREADAQSPGERAFRASMERAWGDLDRVDAAALRRVRDRIGELRADVMDRIAALPITKVDGVETFQSTSLRAFSAELQDAAARYAQRAGLDLAQDLRRTGAMSDTAHRDALSALARANGVPPSMIVLSPLGISDEQIEAAVLFSNSAITNVSQAVIQTVNRELQAVVFGGQSRWDALRNIRTALGTTGRDIGDLTSRADMIERTGLIAAFNIAAEHAYRQATDELPDLQVEWMATQGPRTCPTCASLNGARKKPGGTFPGGIVAPPRHPRCRCRVVAYLPHWDAHIAPPAAPGTPAAPPTARRPAVTTPPKPPPPPPFQAPGAFTSLAEAERGMHHLYPHITYDFAGAHIDTINPSMAKLHDLSQRYPQVAARLEYVGTVTTPGTLKYGGGFDAKSKANTVAYATRDGKAIGLNAVYYGSPDRLIDAGQRSVATKFHPPGTEPLGSWITHEFGHQVDNWSRSRGAYEQILPAWWPSGVGLRNDTVDRFLEARKRSIGQLAAYGKGSKAEAFAELFSALEYTTPRPPIVRQFQVLMDEVINAPAAPKLPGKQYGAMVRDLPDAERQAAIAAMQALAKKLGVKFP